MAWFDLYAMFAPLVCFVMGTMFGASLMLLQARANTRRPPYHRR
jgi:hypothetical protein